MSDREGVGTKLYWHRCLPNMHPTTWDMICKAGQYQRSYTANRHSPSASGALCGNCGHSSNSLRRDEACTPLKRQPLEEVSPVVVAAVPSCFDQERISHTPRGSPTQLFQSFHHLNQTLSKLNVQQLRAPAISHARRDPRNDTTIRH